MPRRRKKRFGGIAFLVFLLIIGLMYLYFLEIKRVDYTLRSQEINEAINEVLIDLGISDIDILKIYREEKKQRNRKWIHITKEVKIPQDADFSKYKEAIFTKIKSLDAEIITSKIDDSGNVLTMQIGTRKMVMQTLIFRKISIHKIAIIIDDVGYQKGTLSKFLEIGLPLTFSILPHQRYSKEIASELITKGYSIILHLPLEPYGYPSIDPGSHAVLLDMSEKKIKEVVENDIKSVPGIQGMNNHMGSKFTENSNKMKQVLEVLKKHNLFYVDSQTSSNSVAYQTARKLGMKTTKRDIFIDNEDDIEYIKEQLRKLSEVAIKHGSAIGIGHIHKQKTAQAIGEMIPEFNEKNIKIVFVSELME